MIDNINMPEIRVPEQYHTFGPFGVPEKKKWVIVGSGPTADLLPRFLEDNPDAGVVSLNAQLGAIPKSTVHIVGHYEYFLQCIHALEKPDVLFFANPMHVGYRCQPVAAINLLDFTYYANTMGNRLRFFRKENELGGDGLLDAAMRTGGLYCHETIAATALHLLSKNKVKEVFFLGIDGQKISDERGRAKMFEDAYRVRIPNSRLPKTHINRLDRERVEFFSIANHFGINVKEVSEIYSKELVGA